MPGSQQQSQSPLSSYTYPSGDSASHPPVHQPRRQRMAWPSLPQCPDGTAAPQHDRLIMGTLRSSCKGPRRGREGSRGCESGRRRLWGCGATLTVFYRNFTPLLRCLYDSVQYLWYAPRTLSERPLPGGSSLRQDTPLLAQLRISMDSALCCSIRSMDYAGYYR